MRPVPVRSPFPQENEPGKRDCGDKLTKKNAAEIGPLPGKTDRAARYSGRDGRGRPMKIAVRAAENPDVPARFIP